MLMLTLHRFAQKLTLSFPHNGKRQNTNGFHRISTISFPVDLAPLM